MNPKASKLSSSDVILEVANRLTCLDYIKDVSSRKDNFIPAFQAHPWNSITLSHGLPGLIVFFAEMAHCFPHEDWDQTTHQMMQLLVQAIEAEGIHNLTLFSGLTGVCFAIELASKNGSRYQTLLSQLEAHLLTAVQTEFVELIQKQLNEGLPVSPLLYDTITGINGNLAYLLQRMDNHEAVSLATTLVRQLVELTHPILWKGHLSPGWVTAPHDLVLQEHRDAYREGCFDTGLAHGIAGSLSLLSQAYLRGIQVEGQLSAIESIAGWLEETQCSVGEFKNVWPGRFVFDSDVPNRCKSTSSFYRDGWCYGAPGIACSLWHASQAMKKESLANFSLSLMHEVCDRYVLQNNLSCPSFCHGQAGLLTMLWQMQLETGSKKLRSSCDAIARDILEQYDSTHPFGFKTEASFPDSDAVLKIDNAGLLDGVTGILLPLLFLKSGERRPWLSLFVL
ncbi:MAG: lanthionine synthetase C family protein [Parachlamydia sp.]|nr:lanthionine synthetase C family protein [Parachlamydia sp.]